MKKWLLFLTLLSASLSATNDCCFNSCECCSIEHSGYLHFKHREPGGIGYPRGYTTLGLFYTGSHCGPTYSFLDLRAHLDNAGQWATNVGLGTRSIAKYHDVISGFNFYWDWRHGKRGSYHKIGVGSEILWPYWDLHFNVYIPIGKKRKTIRQGFDHFEGHRAIMFKKYLLNMGGVDASVGYWLFKCGCVDMHASLGGYYFRGNFKADFGGAIAKAKLRFWNWIELEGQVSYDNKFKWVGQGELGIYIPFGPVLNRYPRKTGCCADLIALEQRLLEQPDRFEISVLASHKRKDKAHHPITNELLTFYFVDNTSSSDGTFESPFPTISQAEAASSTGDAIYVFPGNGSGYDETLTLKDKQLFGGSGGPFEVQTRFGLLEIPPLTNIKPAMIGTDNKVIVTSNNRITGMSLTSSDADTIIGSAVRNLIIKDNFISVDATAGTEFGGINLSNVSMNCLIQNNLIVGNQTGAAPVDGIFVDGLSGSFVATKNTINTDNSGNVANGFKFLGTLNPQIEIFDNTFSNNGTEGSCIESETPIHGLFHVKNNSLSCTASTTVSSAITLLGGFVGSVVIENNQIHSVGEVGGRGIQMPALGVSTGSFLVNNNSFFCQGNVDLTVAFITFQSFTGNMTFTNNTFDIRGGIDAWGLNYASSISFFNGNFTATNNTFVFQATNSSRTVNWETPFSGTFTFSNNHSQDNGSGTNGGGIVIGENISGNFILDSNYMNVKRRGITNLGPSVISDGNVFLRNNTFVQTENPASSAIEIRTTGIDAIVHNNLIFIQDGTAPSVLWENTSGISHIQFADNTSTSGAATDTEFTVSGGTLELESPNMKLSGVQAINEGVIDAPGVTFVPFE